MDFDYNQSVQNARETYHRYFYNIDWNHYDREEDEYHILCIKGFRIYLNMLYDIRQRGTNILSDAEQVDLTRLIHNVSRGIDYEQSILNRIRQQQNSHRSN